MRLQSILSLIFLILLSSCHKKEVDTVRFSGIVIDAKDNLPMPNVLARLQLYYTGDINSTSLQDSIWTDDLGSYEFSVRQTDYNSYYIFTYKAGYMLNLPCGIFGVAGKSINNSKINYDTIVIGRKGVLKINFNILDTNWTYVISSSSACYDTRNYKVDVNYLSQELTFKYLYDDNHQVNVSWYKYDWNYDTIFNEEFKIIDLIPMDTSYLTLDLK